MGKEFVEQVEAAPVIAAVKDEEGLAACLKSDVEVVFILYGDICTIGDIVKTVKEAGKTAMVHIDLISGLSIREAALDFIADFVKADGVITTRTGLIAYAKELGLNTVLRYFVIDSMALMSIGKLAGSSVRPDMIEILPGVLPSEMIRSICRESKAPVICGGLIKNREDVMNALRSGAAAISTSSPGVWFM